MLKFNLGHAAKSGSHVRHVVSIENVKALFQGLIFITNLSLVPHFLDQSSLYYVTPVLVSIFVLSLFCSPIVGVFADA